MCSIEIRFQTQHESLIVPTMESGSHVMELMRSRFEKLVLDVSNLESNRESIHVILSKNADVIQEQLYFTTIFGQSDYAGLISFINAQIQSLQI